MALLIPDSACVHAQHAQVAEMGNWRRMGWKRMVSQDQSSLFLTMFIHFPAILGSCWGDMGRYVSFTYLVRILPVSDLYRTRTESVSVKRPCFGRTGT